MSRRCVPCCKTRNGTAGSTIRRVLVVLHTGVLHSFAACPVGWNQGRGEKNEYFRPDLPPATRSPQWQVDHFVSERNVAQYRAPAIRGTVHDGALRWSRN